MKAYAYLRVSGESQLNGGGYDRQRETISAWAERAGCEIVAWYADAYTGTEADRPELTRLLGEINGVHTIVIESMDRLARDLYVQMILLARLADAGITLYAANTGEDVIAASKADPMKNALIQIQGVFAELEKKSIVRKLRMSRDRKRSLGGKSDGDYPYGHREGEREILERMLAMAGAGMTHKKITETLNAEGIPTRKGVKWCQPYVSRVLKRERTRRT